MSQYDLIDDRRKKDVVKAEAYRFIKKIGEGSFAIVFLAEFFNEPFKKVACKVIDTGKAPPEYTTKFLPRELDVLRKLNHPHIISVYAIYQKSSKYLIFMRYAENGDLLDFLLKAGAIFENQARIWVRQIGLALEYLHELEIAHRDLKCENILVTANYNVKLSDFGFARSVLNKRGLRMLSTTYCGSISYCAPEIIKGVPYNPKISDLWSLGVVVFVMLNNALPYDTVNIKKLYQQQINRKWKFKPNIDTVASKEVKELLQNLLEPVTDKRYTISELLNSPWFYMDHRLLGMNEEESLALIKAKEERRKMEQILLASKPGGERQIKAQTRQRINKKIATQNQALKEIKK